MHARRVLVVDDDEGVRTALKALLESAGFVVKTFGNAKDFLADSTAEQSGCLLLDIRMPGVGGIALHDALIMAGNKLPVIILTGHGDVPMAVGEMKRGAFDFILKPFNDQVLIDRINEAMQEEFSTRSQDKEASDLRNKFQRLTARESEVLKGVVRGLANKAIASELSISERTVESHRAHCMDKLECRSIAQLVRLATQAGLIN